MPQGLSPLPPTSRSQLPARTDRRPGSFAHDRCSGLRRTRTIECRSRCAPHRTRNARRTRGPHPAPWIHSRTVPEPHQLPFLLRARRHLRRIRSTMPARHLRRAWDASRRGRSIEPTRRPLPQNDWTLGRLDIRDSRLREPAQGDHMSHSAQQPTLCQLNSLDHHGSLRSELQGSPPICASLR